MQHQNTLCPESVVFRRLPANYVPTDSDLFQPDVERAIPACVLLGLENVAIGYTGVLFSNGKALPLSFPSPRVATRLRLFKAKLRLYASTYLTSWRNSKIDGDAFWVTDSWSNNYFHWITDALPRLFTIREKLHDATLLLPRKYENIEYVKASLKCFSIKRVQYIRGVCNCRKLWVPTHTAPTGHYNEKLIRDLRQFLLGPQSPEAGASVGDRIYISRKKAKSRKIGNEEACEAILAEYGFKTVYLENFSFEQQVSLFKNTQYLVSIHGAGLTNMLFMKGGSSVLEIRKHDAKNNCYFSLASALHLRYHYQLCDSVGPEEEAQTANLIVDCQQLKKSIEQMLEA